MTKVVIADLQPVAREGIKMVLGKLHICSETTNGQEALRAVSVHKPDIIILDVSLSVLDGMGVLKELQSSHSKVKPIVFSNNEDTSVILECIELGAQAYLSKKEGLHELSNAIKAVLNSPEPYTNKLVRDALWKGRRTPVFHIELTEKEKVYMELFCSGKSKTEIAERMGFSVRTIEDYRYNLFKKTGSANDVMLTNYAFEHGLHPLKKAL